MLQSSYMFVILGLLVKILQEDPKQRYNVKQIKNHKWYLRSFGKNKHSPSNSPSDSYLKPFKRMCSANGNDSILDSQ